MAAGLIGKILSHGPLRGQIVEVEAYDEREPASRGFAGPHNGNATLFGARGHLEVYLTYGVHYLTTVVCAPVGVGSGVLLRALEPLTGMAQIRADRGDHVDPDRQLCSGPRRLSRAFGLSRTDDRAALVVGRIRVLDDGFAPPYVRSTRVGVSKGKDLNWRFFVDGRPSVSVSHVSVAPVGMAESPMAR